jgi:hypothetical protein
MAKTADNNFDDEIEPCRDDEITPRTPWLLWVIVFVIVTLMVVWSIRTFGTRSSASDATPAHQPATTHTAQATT